MCGIAGAAAKGPSASVGPAVLAALRHRGPDAEATRTWSGTNSSWALAHTRLSIVDLSPAGEQPMEDEDGSLVMVFNGEIYNSPELRRYCEAKGHRFRSTMDGEVILHLWEMEGAACLGRLNGIFAVAIADTRTGEVVVARDPLGVKPLFYSQGTGRPAVVRVGARRASGGGGAARRSRPRSPGPVPLVPLGPRPSDPVRRSQEPRAGQALRWTPDGSSALFFYGEPLVPDARGRRRSP